MAHGQLEGASRRIQHHSLNPRSCTYKMRGNCSRQADLRCARWHRPWAGKFGLPTGLRPAPNRSGPFHESEGDRLKQPMAQSLLLIALLAGCANLDARRASSGLNSEYSAATSQRYVQNESSACVYEIQAGRLAIQRAANPALRSFARTMVKEHSRLLLQLEQAARNSGAMTTAGTMLPQHLALLARLQSSGQDFDEVYRNIDVMTHLQALNRHRTYLVTGQNADLRNNALIALPLTRNHLNQAQSITLRPR